MKIAESQLRKIIKEEIARKIRLSEVVTLDDVVKGITDEKVKDLDKLQNALSKFVDSGGDAAKNSLKDKDNLEKLKKAYQDQGGKPEEIDSVTKEIITGKLQLTGDVAAAAKSAAAALGNPEDANKLAQVVTAIKGGKKVEDLSADYLKVLARLAGDFIFQDKADTLNAAKALSKAGAKK